MKILVTAGNTQTAIDRVRCITNIFSGRTGAQIATYAFDQGHAVTLLTSHPETVPSAPSGLRTSTGWRVRVYRSFEQLEAKMADEVIHGGYDAIVHAAAVSDFHVAGVYAPEAGSHFDQDAMTWRSDVGAPRLADAGTGKVKSCHEELWLRLTSAPKLVDRIRSAWAFRGTLVKFKLEVGIGEDGLLVVAERARLQSGADLMVANTLEGMHDWAYLGRCGASYERVPRTELPLRLLEALAAADALRVVVGRTLHERTEDGCGSALFPGRVR